MLRTITASLDRILFPTLAAAVLGMYLAVAIANRRAEPADHFSLSRLKRRMIGRGQQQIEKLLGHPRTVTTGPMPIWYYAVDAQQHLAMAISFHNNRAARVEFFHPSPLDPQSATLDSPWK